MFLLFPTRLLVEYVREEAPERIATTVYGINLLLCSVLPSVLWRFAVRERLVRLDSSERWRCSPGGSRPVWPATWP